MEQYFYDRQGRRISMEEWGRLRADKRRVAQGTIKHLWVSTVWLGIDHGFGFGPPVIFETMVFPAKKRTRRSVATDMYMRRYHTEKEALRGHSDICRMIRSGWRG